MIRTENQQQRHELALVETADTIDDLTSSIGEIAAEFGVESGAPEAIIEGLIARRTSARAERDWATGDGIRDRLADIGITLEDGSDGTTWHRS